MQEYLKTGAWLEGVLVSAPRPRIPEALRGARKKARKAGWTVICNGNGHLRWTPPEGSGLPVIVTPSTPNGGRHSIGNSRQDLKRAGLL
jgi:hypothetical protein